jgi:hypothetical protein
MTKVCAKCHRQLPADLTHFYRCPSARDGLRGICRDCRNEYLRQAHHRHYQKHKAALVLKARLDRQLDPARYKATALRYSQSHRAVRVAYYYSHQDEHSKREAARRQDNPTRVHEIERASYYRRLETSVPFKIRKRLSARIHHSLVHGKQGHSWEALVGYSVEDLIEHLESLFKPGMTWGNYGQWHIDHIRPVASFHFATYDDPDFKACWSLSNLQPLWAIENLRKGHRDRIPLSS